MDDDVDVVEGSPEAIAIPDVADEEPDAAVFPELGLEVVLLQLVPAKDDDPAGSVAVQGSPDEPTAE